MCRLSQIPGRRLVRSKTSRLLRLLKGLARALRLTAFGELLLLQQLESSERKSQLTLATFCRSIYKIMAKERRGATSPPHIQVRCVHELRAAKRVQRLICRRSIWEADARTPDIPPKCLIHFQKSGSDLSEKSGPNLGVIWPD